MGFIIRKKQKKEASEQRGGNFKDPASFNEYPHTRTQTQNFDESVPKGS